MRPHRSLHPRLSRLLPALMCAALAFLFPGVAHAAGAATNGVPTMQDIPALEMTDPDLAATRAWLAADLFPCASLDARKKALVHLVTLAATQACEGMEAEVAAALDAGASPLDIREALYQCAPYAGFPRAEAALRRANAAFAARGVALPLESAATVTETTRFADGLAVQKGIFGDAIDAMHASCPAGQEPIIVRALSAFCFGDTYTRSHLDLKERELLTFAIIAALGGCEPQVKAHAQGNASVGNTRQELVDALAVMLPDIGFPRALNALACVNAVMK